jgi:hypothetical protein
MFEWSKSSEALQDSGRVGKNYEAGLCGNYCGAEIYTYAELKKLSKKIFL